MIIVLYGMDVDTLHRPHWEEQQSRIADSYRYFTLLNDFDDELFHPGTKVIVPNLTCGIAPSEGWAIPEADDIYMDPHGTRFAHHDIIPREMLLQEDPDCPYRDGAERDMYIIVDHLKQVLSEHPTHHILLSGVQSINEHFTVGGDMDVQIVNIVHTSYLSAYGYKPPARPPKVIGKGNAATTTTTAKERQPRRATKTILPHRWMWRNLMHLGPQQNHVNTSLKLCFLPPFSSVHLIFQTGRVLETGAANLETARIMIEHVTLNLFRIAGIHSLLIHERETQNVVATSRMPNHAGLCLDLIQWRMPGVCYDPDEFPGAVIIHPEFPKIVFLAFAGGPLVCVGPSSTENMKSAFTDMYPIFTNHTDTPENRKLEQEAHTSHARTALPKSIKKYKKKKTTNESARQPRREPQRRILGGPV